MKVFISIQVSNRAATFRIKKCFLKECLVIRESSCTFVINQLVQSMKTSTLGIILLLLLIGLCIYTQWPRVSDNSTTSELDSLKQVIKTYEQQTKELLAEMDSLKGVNSKLAVKYDSLEKTKVQIKIKYREIYKYIEHASNAELDSIIRKNW